MESNDLIENLKTAFKGVALEDGIGLWEAQGMDNYADENELQRLKAKDERTDWNNLPYEDLAYCESSLSFLDAKGMRFCLPKFVLFDLLETQIQREQNLSSPDVIFILSHDLEADYQKNRFSLFNKTQVQSIIHFMEYKLEIANQNDDEFTVAQLMPALKHWQNKTSLI